MPASEEQLRKFEILLKHFQNVGKAQALYVNSLVLFVILVWAVEILHQSGGITITMLGASLKISGLWQIVPLVTTILVLAIAGSINVTMHAWRRLHLLILEICEEDHFFFIELDPYKNIIDYLGFLTPRLKKPILPDTINAARRQRTSFRFSTLLYPALILCSIETTYASLIHLPWEGHSFAYVFTAVGVQSLFALPLMWRKFCQFFGVHKDGDDGIEWGTEALEQMPLTTLTRIATRPPAHE